MVTLFPDPFCCSIDLHFHVLFVPSLHHFQDPSEFCCNITYTFFFLHHRYNISWPSVVASRPHSDCTMVTAFPGPFCCSITYTVCLYHGYSISWSLLLQHHLHSLSAPSSHYFLDPSVVALTFTYTLCLYYPLNDDAGQKKSQLTTLFREIRKEVFCDTWSYLTL